jgi:hypothetical protein
MVDGVRMNHNDGRGAARRGDINRGNIQELSVLTGVTPAEYGNAQGGVISVVTKDGGSDLNGWAEFRYEPAGKKHWGTNVYDAPDQKDNLKWDDAQWRNEKFPDLTDEAPAQAAFWETMAGELIHKRTDYDEQIGYGVEGSIAGPIGDRVSFVATSRYGHFAAAAPAAERTGFYRGDGGFVADSGNYNFTGTLTARLTPNLKVKASGMFQGWEEYWGDQRGTGGNLFMPEKYGSAGKMEFREDLQYVLVTHTVSPKTFYEVRMTRSVSTQDTLSGTASVTKGIQRDKAGDYTLGRQRAWWEEWHRKRFGFKVDLSSQATKGNFMKMGIEVLRGSLDMMQLYFYDASNRRMRMLVDESTPGKAVHPLHVNFYVQDKMEFQGMIVNVGLRIDTFSGNVNAISLGTFRGSEMWRYYTVRRDLGYQAGNIWFDDAPRQMFYSPRVGIAHPITERSQMRFSSGVFLQWADQWWSYGEDYYSAGLSADADLNGNGRLDDTELYNNMMTTYSGQQGTFMHNPQKTTAFEVGADWNFVADYTATLTAYYKVEVDSYTHYPNENWLGPRVTGAKYNRTIDNGAHGDARGIEFSLRKAFSHNFSFNMSYNYQYSQVTTGGRGNIYRNTYVDSAGVKALMALTMYNDENTGAAVPGIWLTMEPASDGSGRRVPVPITQAQWETYVRPSNARYIRSRDVYHYGAPFAMGYYEGITPVPGVLGEQYGVGLNTAAYTTYFPRSKSGDRRHFGAVNLLASFPDGFEFGHPFLGSALENMRISVTSRIQTGTMYNFSPPTGGDATSRQRPMDSRTDLAVEKTWNVSGRVQPTLFVDVRNIWNQKDRNSPSSTSDYTWLGIDGPNPTNSDYQLYGDTRDRSFAHRPRQAQFGLRLNW